MKDDNKIIIILGVLLGFFLAFGIILLFVYFFIIKKSISSSSQEISFFENLPEQFDLLSLIGNIVIVQNGGTGIGSIPQDFIPVGGNGGGPIVNAFIDRPPGNFVGISDTQTVANTTFQTNNTIQDGIQVTGTGNNYSFNMPTNTNFVIRDVSNVDLIDFSDLSGVPRVYFRSTETFIANTGGLRFQWAKGDPNYVDRPLRSFPVCSSSIIVGSMIVGGVGTITTNSVNLNIIKYGRSVTVTYSNIQFSFVNIGATTNATNISLGAKSNFSTPSLFGSIVRILSTNTTPNDIFGQVTIGTGNVQINFQQLSFTASASITVTLSPITFSYYQDSNQ